MENALSASPNSVDALQGLKQLTMFVGDLEAYEVYKERLEQVNREGTGSY